MTHAIFVRDVSHAEAEPRVADASSTVLAHAIPNAGEAATLAGRLATSYPESGADSLRRVFWFRDRKGVHEIWAAPER